MDITEIQKWIPHRYPFLLVDRVTSYEYLKSISGYKNVTGTEPVFQGHFPGVPIMPGVLQLEAMAQLGGIVIKMMPEVKDKLMVFAGMDKVKFKRMVVPGDRLDMYCEVVKFRPPIAVAQCKAMVDGQLTCEAELKVALIDMPNPAP